jgi:hypothetical protein
MPWSGKRGQALTEFIVVIPLFFILLLGVVQLSMLAFAQQTVHYAAFAATRAAIVRPCAAFHPDHEIAANFTPAVFSAAVLSTLAAAPAQQLFPGLPYGWLPILPETPEVEGLDFGTESGPVGGPGELAGYKYANAAYLTAVRRVEPDFGSDPVSWEPTLTGPGLIPCAHPWTPAVERNPHRQNVPPPGSDLSLEVTFLFPMRIPFVNRIFFGIFVNFTSVAQDDLNLSEIRDPGGPIEDVMKHPTRGLPPIARYESSVSQMVNRVMNVYDFSDESRSANIDAVMTDRQWYPLPLRARCTLTTEGSLVPLVTFPW